MRNRITTPLGLFFFSITVALLSWVSPTLAESTRVVRDATRNNLWVLQQDAVYLHDATTRILKQRFELPGWTNADESYACPPALALDAHGAAVISSNVIPVLWRVDPAKGSVTKHELVTDADTDKDVGFTGLAYAADQGVFFAAGATFASLWRIDALLRRAQKVALSAPLRRACTVAVDQGE
jgi:hypothetical protein